MSQAAKTIFIFGIYVVVLGILLAIHPNLVIGPFGFPIAQEPWIRVLGVLAFVLGGYYVQAARGGVTAFFRWSVGGRAMILLGFVGLVLAGLAQPALILFGVIDAGGAMWTAYALKQDANRA